MNCESYNLFFENFSNKTRLKIIEVLDKEPLSVSEIVKKTGEEQSNISHNLKKLTECRLVDVKRQGKKRIYSLNKETTVPLIKLVKKHVAGYCCKTCLKKKD